MNKAAFLNSKFNLEKVKILFKSDTQGYELDVFQGAANFLMYVNTVIVEVDFYYFYENESNSQDIVNYLYDHDFILTGFIYPPALNEKGEILAGDFIFRRASTRRS